VAGGPSLGTYWAQDIRGLTCGWVIMPCV